MELYKTSIHLRQDYRFMLLALVLCVMSSIVNAQITTSLDKEYFSSALLQYDIESASLNRNLTEKTNGKSSFQQKTKEEPNGEDESERKINKHKVFFDGTSYHRTRGWVNSLGFSIGAYTNAGYKPLVELEYHTYWLLKSKLGLGAGLSYKRAPSSEPAIGDYEFTELFFYTKYYLNDNRNRLYVDTKLGFALAPEGSISCFSCVRENYTTSLKYTNGEMLQSGLGFDFATTHRIKWGVRLNFYCNYLGELIDEFEGTDFGTLGGSRGGRGYNSGLLLGFNFYL